MVYFPDPVKIFLRKPFTHMRCRKITQHKITSDCASLITNSQFAISQYGQIRPCDKCTSSNHTYQLLIASITIFLQSLSIGRMSSVEG